MNHVDEFQLNEYLDGELDEAERQAIAAHLATCADCRQALNELQTLFLALDELAEIELTADLLAPVLTELQAQTQPETIPWLRPLLALQLAGVLAMLVWLWPSMQAWLKEGATTVGALFAGVEPIRLILWERMTTWGTAVLQQWQQARPDIDLAAGQWALLLGLALISWLAGNRLILTNE